MNLLYDDINKEHIQLHTTNIENPNISFNEYIANINKNMVRKCEDPDPGHDPDCAGGAKGAGDRQASDLCTDPDPDPNHTSMGHDDTHEWAVKGAPMGALHRPHKVSDPTNATSYRVGLTQCDTDKTEIIMDTIADSGADIDVISGRHKHTYHNITNLVNTTLNGIGGASRVHEAADHEHLPGLTTDQGIINDNSDTTCLSIPKRAIKGWLFWASGGVAQLVSPTKTAFNFILKEGLYRLTNKITEYEGVTFGERDDLMSYEELTNDDHHSMMKSVLKPLGE